MRIVGGSNRFEGRVEMCYREEWGTICDNQFGRFEAAVVCSQLGFSRLRKDLKENQRIDLYFYIVCIQV